MECSICYELIDENLIVKYELLNNLCKYDYCIDCTNFLIENQFSNHINNIINADCLRTLKNSLRYSIPEKITTNTLTSGIPIDRLYFNGNYLDSDIKIPLSKTKFNLLKKELRGVYENLEKDEYDYMKEINDIFKKYGII